MKTKMKKILCGLLIIVVAASLSCCGEKRYSLEEFCLNEVKTNYDSEEFILWEITELDGNYGENAGAYIIKIYRDANEEEADDADIFAIDYWICGIALKSNFKISLGNFCDDKTYSADDIYDLDCDRFKTELVGDYTEAKKQEGK